MGLRPCFQLVVCMFMCMFIIGQYKIPNLEGEVSSKYPLKSSVSKFHKHLRTWKWGNARPKELEDGISKSSNRNGNKTVILMWTGYYSMNNDSLLDTILSKRKWDPTCCSGQDLIVTLDRSLLRNATFVVFYFYTVNLRMTDLPTRYPHQLWVLFGKESPRYSPKPKYYYSDMFNLTMTYRLDSDIYSPYGFIEKRNPPIPPSKPILMPGDIPFWDWIGNKTKLMSGVISNCKTPSRREKVIRALENASLPLEMYGRCGKHRICERTNHASKCGHQKFWRNLGQSSFFYFAAENSLCVDYITEKFWRTLELGMVPVVYGAEGGDYAKVAPPNSFVDLAKFKGPRGLTKYLERVSNNLEEYSKFFEWRREYIVQLTDGWGGWCKLCRLAKEFRESGKMEGINLRKKHNLEDWWLFRSDGEGGKRRACQ